MTSWHATATGVRRPHFPATSRGRHSRSPVRGFEVAHHNPPATNNSGGSSLGYARLTFPPPDPTAAVEKIVEQLAHTNALLEQMLKALQQIAAKQSGG